MDPVATLAEVIRDAEWELEFTILDIGAREVHEEPEPFYRLRKLFPGSRIIAFEPDEALFFRELFGERTLWNEQRLKLAVLAMLYDCLDVALFCCTYVDRTEGESIETELRRRWA